MNLGRAVALLVVLAGLGVGAPPALAAPVSSATLFDEAELDARWTAAANATYAIEGDAREVQVSVRDPDGDDYWFWFASPPPAFLKAGVYDRAMRATPKAGRPGMYISRPSSSCNSYDGRFEIKDFALGADGVPSRLWVVYEYLCDGGQPEFGEVRYATQRPDGAAFAVPAVQRWAANDFGRPRIAVPVTVRATTPAQLGTARISGTNPPDFVIESDGCSGRQLAAGASCDVLVRFRAQAPGARTAVLDLGGGVQSQLQGFNYGGRTRLDIDGESTDPEEPEKFGVFTPADTWIKAYGGGSGAGFLASRGHDGGWVGSFRAAHDDPLVPGSYSGTRPNTHQQLPQPVPGLEIAGLGPYGGPCTNSTGEFTVTEIAHYPDGAVRSFAASFTEHCPAPTYRPLVTGSVAFRAGDTTPPAPWMTGGPAGAPDPGVAGSPLAPAGRAPWRCRGRAASRTPTLGTRRANHLRGSWRAERIVAGAGDDRVVAGRGDDCVDGGRGRDRLYGGAGADLLRGGPGRDVLIGGRARIGSTAAAVATSPMPDAAIAPEAASASGGSDQQVRARRAVRRAS